jgi:thiosulfate/3-mercaptopyruvate sulfurtransferase
MQPSADRPLIDVPELALLVADDDVTLLDVRYCLGGPPGGPEFARGHIPGAVYVDLDAALAGAPGPRGRHPLPDTEVFEEAMRAAGVCQDRPVVVYDDWAGRAAARCWWLLRWAGHRDARVLDGGWSAWVAAGGDQSDVQKSPERGDFTARPGLLPVLAVDDVLNAARTGVLVDARSPERFRGEVEPVDPVAGHIPGAVNVPTAQNLTRDGRFRPAGELRELYAAAAGREAAVYCGSGVTATHDILAMAVAGIDAALYPGSWSEWVADGERPVSTGPEDASGSTSTTASGVSGP